MSGTTNEFTPEDLWHLLDMFCFDVTVVEAEEEEEIRFNPLLASAGKLMGR